MVLLAIESSCDDTAAAVLADGAVHSNIISSQHDLHESFGGVVPELASRDHQRLIVPVVEAALGEANRSFDDVDAVAVTHGPGLPGSLLVGLSFAKAFARATRSPLVGVNHLEGHLYSVDIDTPRPPRPYLCLVVSGGHTQLVLVEEDFQHTVLGQTRDDAAGEAFDKVAQLLDLGYPGGPPIDRHAADGDPTFHDFPRSSLDGYDFSFSGLKTSVLYYLREFSDAERRQTTTATTCAPPSRRPSSTCSSTPSAARPTPRAWSTWPWSAACRRIANCGDGSRPPAPPTGSRCTFRRWSTAWTMRP